MKETSFRQQYGPWALVTGAAAGLGCEFAQQLAAKGLHLILVDRDEVPLRQLAAQLAETDAIETKPVTVDLADADFMQVITAAAEGLEVGLLINNAGASLVRLFAQATPAQLQIILDVNTRAPLHLAHHFGQQMLTRRRGGVIFLSSFSAYQGSLLVGTYAATKAFNLILAESLWAEWREQGVNVLGFAPGSTDTPGFREANPQTQRATIVSVMSAADTVAEALAALGKQPSAIAGWRNRLAYFLTVRLLPRRWAIRLVSQNMRQLYPHIINGDEA